MKLLQEYLELVSGDSGHRVRVPEAHEGWVRLGPTLSGMSERVCTCGDAAR